MHSTSHLAPALVKPHPTKLPCKACNWGCGKKRTACHSLKFSAQGFAITEVGICKFAQGWRPHQCLPRYHASDLLLRLYFLDHILYGCHVAKGREASCDWSTFRLCEILHLLTPVRVTESMPNLQPVDCYPSSIIIVT